MCYWVCIVLVWQSPNFVFSLVLFHDFVAFYFLKLRCCCMFWPIDGAVIPGIMQFSWRLGREKANLDGVVERERKEAVVACEVSCNTCKVNKWRQPFPAHCWEFYFLQVCDTSTVNTQTKETSTVKTQTRETIPLNTQTTETIPLNTQTTETIPVNTQTKAVARHACLMRKIPPALLKNGQQFIYKSHYWAFRLTAQCGRSE